jgi:hypothetical protein
MSFLLTSPAFAEGQPIPTQYTCDGQDISPPLAWTGAPGGTASFVLINDDPDCTGAPFVHWVLFNLPGHRAELPEKFAKDPELPDGTLQGLNDFGRVGYGGPCPPSGVHRYFFKLYALNQILTLPPKATRVRLEVKMKACILDRAQLMGTYQRIKK